MLFSPREFEITILRCGDTLVIKEMDRLGRDYEAIKNEWQQLQQMGVDIVIIDTPILNTAEKSDTEKSLIANIVFELLAYTAEKERQKIKARQAEGIRLALEKGAKFGRPKFVVLDDFDKMNSTMLRPKSLSLLSSMNCFVLKQQHEYQGSRLRSFFKRQSA